MKKKLFAAVFLAVLTGCAVNVGPGEGVVKIADETQESLLKQFVPGTATTKDVVMQLGTPSDKATGGGVEVWNYRYTRRAAVGIVFVGIPVGSRKVASFYFDEPTGVLQKIDYQTFQQ